jgi:S-adenosyl-L-methionine hydrolase (adenosine-forming)
MKPRVIVIQTDFGMHDAFVAIMKGQIISIDPHVTLIDLTHDISPFNVLSASYNLYSSWDYFPEGTIFLSVVDPGVGSERKVIVAESGGRFLITPDNGSISFAFRMHSPIDTFFPKQELLDKLARDSSSTFQGRDIFAPLAAILARDGFASIKGSSCAPRVLEDAYPEIDSAERKIIGQIVHIDRFGNCISSIHRGDLEKIGGIAQKRITFFGSTISKLNTTYSEVSVGEQVAYIGSAGFLEIGIREGSAADATGLGLHDEILVA